jgi:hypothetical protein
VPLPIPRDLHRVDREHHVPGRDQRLHPRAAVGLNADHHPPGRLVRFQVGPLLGQVLGDQRMQAGQPIQPFPKSGPSQPAAGVVDQLDIVMILGPVVPDEQHPSLPRPTRTRPAAVSRLGDLMVKYSPAPGRGTSSHQPSRLPTTGGRTVCRKTSKAR